MELYFLRHGEAEPAGPGRSDEERSLTDRGRKQTLRVAQALHRAGVRPDRILTSPLRRARQSGEILAEVLGVAAEADDRVLCSACTLGSVRTLISDHPGERLALVGHEPHCSRLVAQLAGGASIHMGTGAAARVDCERVEPGAGTLVWLIAPALLPVE